MKKSNLVLKTLAQQAKDRLRGKSEMINNSAYQRNFKVLVNSQRTDIKSVIISNKDDEKLYAKVRQLIDNGEPISPVKYIMDKSHYQKLTAPEKERYFLTLMDKYRELKQRYEIEKIQEEKRSELI